MDATPAAVDRAIGDPTTDADSEQTTDQQRVVHDGTRLTVDDDHEEIDALELPDDWTETDLEADAVDIEGVDFE